jgi:hypothetical protein
MSGKVYKLYVTGNEEIVYIGSTFKDLEWRLLKHEYSAFNQTRPCRSSIFFQEGNEVVIELLEELTDATQYALQARERYWIEQHPKCVNKNIPGRTHKEWVLANQEHVRAYNQANRPVAREKEKERYANGYGDVRNAKKKEKATCDICQKEMNKNSLWTHKKNVHAPTS